LKKNLVVALVSLCILSLVVPGLSENGDKQVDREWLHDRSFFDCYNSSEVTHCNNERTGVISDLSAQRISNECEQKPSSQGIMDGLMNSSWPMYCHDIKHTGRSPYSTVNTTGVEKWRFISEDWNWGGSPVINDQGIIYFGNDALYAIYPNGTLKWKNGSFSCETTPAIGKDGTIYIGTMYNPNGLSAFDPNGTRKWVYGTGNHVKSSPVIGSDDTIYFGDCNGYVNALYPNGTLRWRYKTGMDIYSSPAIDSDGTVYCGSHDGNLYALYPNNGTVKWAFGTGGWVHGSPTIGGDGMVYIGSDSKNLYALYPSNGTMKWKCSVGSMFAAPALDKEGTLFFGVWESAFRSVYPNGTLKWSFDLGSGNGVWGSSAAISADGTVYFGTFMDEGSGGGELIALNLDGTLKWRKMIATDFIWSSPAIGKDGTVYIASTNDLYHTGSECYLHAFGPGEQKTIKITQPEQGELYLFGHDLGPSPNKKTIIIGSTKVKVQPSQENEIESMNFYVEDSLQYTATEPPFEWTMNERYWKWPPLMRFTLTVVGNYRGGCTWTDSIDVSYFHLRHNYPK
jgi:outer membrane protein assembly factor BamB